MAVSLPCEGICEVFFNVIFIITGIFLRSAASHLHSAVLNLIVIILEVLGHTSSIRCVRDRLIITSRMLCVKFGSYVPSFLFPFQLKAFDMKIKTINLNRVSSVVRSVCLGLWAR